MKKVLQVLGIAWLVSMGLSLQAQEPGPGYRLVGVVSLHVPVTEWKMTNLVFPVPVAAGVKVSRDVLVQRPKGVENVIELKAVKRNFLTTNLSVFGKDGRLYSFDLHYTEDTTVLNYRVILDGGAPMPGVPGLFSAGVGDHPIMLSGLPVDGTALDKDAALLSRRPGFLHKSASTDRVELHLRGIYLRDSLLWLCFRLVNRSSIGFTPAYMRISIEDRIRIIRTAAQKVELLPVYEGGLASVPGCSSRSLAVGLTPFALGKGKKLVVEMADVGGNRELVLEIKGKTVLRARVSK
jgi:hypothetical protein